jgi:hypothetical protein
MESVPGVFNMMVNHLEAAPSVPPPNSVYLLKPTGCTSREECFKAMADQLFTLMGEESVREAVAAYISANYLLTEEGVRYADLRRNTP